MKRPLALVWACLAFMFCCSPSLAYTATKKDLADCDSHDLEVRVAGCTRAIEGKNWPAKALHVLYNQRGQAYLQMKQFDQAIADFTTALKYNPAAAGVLSDRANAYNAIGKFDLAVKDADATLRIAPNNAVAYNAKGAALTQTGDFDAAIEAFTAGIKFGPKLAPLYGNRANAWMMKGELDRALTDFDTNLKLEPKNYAALAGRCSTWREKGESRNALADCDEAINVNSEFAIAFRNRAKVRSDLGEFDKALADYGQSIRLNPASAGSYASRADVWRKQLQFERAIADLNQAIKLDPKVAGAYVTRGQVQEAQGDIDAARESFKASLRLPSVSTGTSKEGFYFEDSMASQKTARARLLALGDAGAVPEGTLYAAKPPAAKPEVPSERRIALVIGNGAYASAPRLTNPPNDARLIAKNLRDIGYQVSEGVDLKRGDMEKLLADFLRGAATANVALFFYAGHGVQIDGQNYLLATDANTDIGDLKSELMNVDTILAGLDDRLRANIVILDACRNNPMLADSTEPASNRSVAIRAGLASTSALGKSGTSGAGTLLAFSTAPGKVALDGAGANSPFSTALGRHLATPGLEVQQMLTRVRADVVAATKSQQVPWSNSSLLGEVYLAGRP